MEDESKKEVPHIGCHRFGGKRNALACAHFDRYRGCRRRCKTLEEAMKSSEDFIEHVKAVYGEFESLLPSKHSLKGLPLEPFGVSCAIMLLRARGGSRRIRHGRTGDATFF